MIKNVKFMLVLLSISFLVIPMGIAASLPTGIKGASNDTAIPAAEYDFSNRRSPINILMYIEDTDIKKLGTDINISTNRLTYGMMVASFLVAGALLSTMETPIFYGLPLFSLISFVMAFIFLVPLIMSIQKKEER